MSSKERDPDGTVWRFSRRITVTIRTGHLLLVACVLVVFLFALLASTLLSAKGLLSRGSGASTGGIVGAVTNPEVLTSRDARYEQVNPAYRNINASALIRISSDEDVIKKREDLIRFIWKGAGFPYDKLPDTVDEGIKDTNFYLLSENFTLDDIERLDRITVNMEYGVNSIAYFFHPKDGNNRLMIYHQGHGGSFERGKENISFFLKNGYSVIAFAMPLLGMNNNPVVNLEGLGPMKMSLHNKLILLDTDNFSSISFFMEPVAAAVNYVEKEYDFDVIAMTGISGGGWTATIYPAIDTRVSLSYPVAGSEPMYLRSEPDFTQGDYEQINPELYRTVNYLELYIMAAHGAGRGQGRRVAARQRLV